VMVALLVDGVGAFGVRVDKEGMEVVLVNLELRCALGRIGVYGFWHFKDGA